MVTAFSLPSFGKVAVVVSCSMYSALPADDTEMYARFGIADCAGRHPQNNGKHTNLPLV